MADRQNVSQPVRQQTGCRISPDSLSGKKPEPVKNSRPKVRLVRQGLSETVGIPIAADMGVVS